jgi:hypothetical protein
VNVVRRVIAFLIGFLLLALLTVLLLVPESVSTFLEDLSVVIRIALVILLYAIALFLVYQEFRLGERRQLQGLLVKAPGAVAALSVESARERVLAAIEKLPGVVGATGEVTARRGRAVIALHVIVDTQDINLPEKQKEINRTLKQVIEKQLGLRMAGSPTVQISLGDEDGAYQPLETPAEPPAEEAEADKEPQPEAPGMGAKLTALVGGLFDRGEKADRLAEPSPDEASLSEPPPLVEERVEDGDLVADAVGDIPGEEVREEEDESITRELPELDFGQPEQPAAAEDGAEDIEQQEAEPQQDDDTDDDAIAASPNVEESPVDPDRFPPEADEPPESSLLPDDDDEHSNDDSEPVDDDDPDRSLPR